MMEGWYHHSAIRQPEAGDHEEDDEEEDDEEEANIETVHVDYKEQYKRLKRKLKYLIYENECYQENLRASRAKLLEIARDRSFLLDRLLQYEKVDVSSSSDSAEDTESSDGEAEPKLETKRKKAEASHHGAHPHSYMSHPHTSNTTSSTKTPTTSKKKRPAAGKGGAKQQIQHLQPSQTFNSMPSSTVTSTMASGSLMSDGHMTPEEVERHLSSRGLSFMELLPERAPPTVPTELFSNDPSLDSESNELGDYENSPSNLGDDCLSVDMMGD